MTKRFLSKTSLTLYGEKMPDISTTVLSEKGQIVIPKEAREKLKLKKGERLVIIISDDKILLEKEKAVKKKLEDDFKDIPKIIESSLSFWDNKYDEVWDNV